MQAFLGPLLAAGVKSGVLGRLASTLAPVAVRGIGTGLEALAPSVFHGAGDAAAKLEPGITATIGSLIGDSTDGGVSPSAAGGAEEKPKEYASGRRLLAPVMRSIANELPVHVSPGHVTTRLAQRRRRRQVAPEGPNQVMTIGELQRRLAGKGALANELIKLPPSVGGGKARLGVVMQNLPEYVGKEKFIFVPRLGALLSVDKEFRNEARRYRAAQMGEEENDDEEVARVYRQYT